MKRFTKVQVITIALFLAYIVWEVYAQIWARGIEGPIIRVDLVLIYPVLFIMAAISIVQAMQKKGKDK